MERRVMAVLLTVFGAFAACAVIYIITLLVNAPEAKEDEDEW